MSAVANRVVAFRSGAATTANQAMIAVNVHNILALRAIVFRVEDRHTQSALNHDDKELWTHLVVGIFGRDRMQPAASVWGRHKAEVRLKGQGSGRRVPQASKGPNINMFRQDLLSGNIRGIGGNSTIGVNNGAARGESPIGIGAG
jgi:hypothetical protein